MVETVIAEGIPAHLYEEAIEAGRTVIRQHIAETGGPRPTRVTVGYDEPGEEFVCVLDVPDPVIARKRRITGYLSDYSNFNPSKKAEAKDRVKHLRLAQ